MKDINVRMKNHFQQKLIEQIMNKNTSNLTVLCIIELAILLP